MTMSLPSSMISQHGKELKIIDGYKIRFHKMLNGDVKRWWLIDLFLIMGATREKNLQKILGIYI